MRGFVLLAFPIPLIPKTTKNSQIPPKKMKKNKNLTLLQFSSTTSVSLFPISLFFRSVSPPSTFLSFYYFSNRAESHPPISPIFYFQKPERTCFFFWEQFFYVFFFSSLQHKKINHLELIKSLISFLFLMTKHARLGIIFTNLFSFFFFEYFLLSNPAYVTPSSAFRPPTQRSLHISPPSFPPKKKSLNLPASYLMFRETRKHLFL